MTVTINTPATFGRPSSDTPPSLLPPAQAPVTTKTIYFSFNSFTFNIFLLGCKAKLIALTLVQTFSYIGLILGQSNALNQMKAVPVIK
jgi:hypothetical protein